MNLGNSSVSFDFLNDAAVLNVVVIYSEVDVQASAPEQ